MTGVPFLFIKIGSLNKKIALIANNRYEWCVSYLAITTSNMVVVPLDKMLPENEIKSLIERSKVDAVIYEDKYSEIFDNIKKENIGLIEVMGLAVLPARLAKEIVLLEDAMLNAFSTPIAVSIRGIRPTVFFSKPSFSSSSVM